MKKIIAALVLVAAGTSAALAGPIEDRQGVMKQLQGVMKSGLPISQGKAPFDAAAHKTMMDPMVAGAEKFGTLFPAGTGPGNGIKTQATAAVWSDAAGFKAASTKFVADIRTLAAAKDQASFAAGFKALQSGCAGCHKAYRGPAS
jgi:cytochrome c556